MAEKGLAAQRNVAILPGDTPIAVVGAIGVAGGKGGEDQPIAEAGLAAPAPVGA